MVGGLSSKNTLQFDPLFYSTTFMEAAGPSTSGATLDLLEVKDNEGEEAVTKQDVALLFASSGTAKRYQECCRITRELRRQRCCCCERRKRC